jgi:hypothetical protein
MLNFQTSDPFSHVYTGLVPTSNVLHDVTYTGKCTPLYRVFLLWPHRTWQLYRIASVHSPERPVTAAVKWFRYEADQSSQSVAEVKTE